MVEKGIKDFVIPIADEDGEHFEVSTTAGCFDVFEGLFQSGQTTGWVSDGQVF